jgi:serpin B
MRKQTIFKAAACGLAVALSGTGRGQEPQFMSAFCRAAETSLVASDYEHLERDVAGPQLAFALGLHKHVAQASGKGNVVDSPFSIASALGLALAGAKGTTATEMGKVLGLGGAPKPAWLKAVAALNHALLCPSKYQTTTFDLANGLFVQKGKELKAKYLDAVGKHFDAKVESLDYEHDANGARKHINDWVAVATRQKILDLIPDKAIDGDTRVVLANAVYLKGSWKHTFRKKDTKPRPFHLSPKSKADVPTMYAQGDSTTYKYAKAPGLQAVAMPFGDELADFVVIVPDAVDGLEKVEKSLTRESMTKLLNALEHRKVNLALPKFRAESALSVRAALEALGMKAAFAPRKADFSGIDGGTDFLYVSEVVHKAFIDVDEVGVEAAAATAVMMATGAAPPPPSKPVEVKVDRPFLFAVVGTANSVLFMGRITDPRHADKP